MSINIPIFWILVNTIFKCKYIEIEVKLNWLVLTNF